MFCIVNVFRCLSFCVENAFECLFIKKLKASTELYFSVKSSSRRRSFNASIMLMISIMNVIIRVDTSHWQYHSPLDVTSTATYAEHFGDKNTRIDPIIPNVIITSIHRQHRAPSLVSMATVKRNNNNNNTSSKIIIERSTRDSLGTKSTTSFTRSSGHVHDYTVLKLLPPPLHETSRTGDLAEPSTCRTRAPPRRSPTGTPVASIGRSCRRRRYCSATDGSVADS